MCCHIANKEADAGVDFTAIPLSFWLQCTEPKPKIYLKRKGKKAG
jgi:hypothetical protein